jgi:hypothetical protein
MAQPGFDEEAAERWMQSRVGVRHADASDPMARFRNTSRSMFVDRKNYTGGALRGAVSDRRAEWMGGGAGGRIGEDWRQHQMIDVDRHGSGLDPFSYAAAKKIQSGVAKRRAAKAGGLNDRQWLSRERQRSSARKIADMRAGGGEPEVIEAAPAATPDLSLFPNDTGAVGPEEAAWNASFSGMKDRIKARTGPQGTVGTSGSY